MKRKLLRLMALWMALAILLTGCSGPESSDESDIPEALPSQQMAVPQTTATPVEQTGVGYIVEETEMKNQTLVYSQLVVAEKSVWLVTADSSGVCTMKPVCGGGDVTISDLDGVIMGGCGTDDGFWLCMRADTAACQLLLISGGAAEKTVDFTLDSGYIISLAVDGNGYFYLLNDNKVLVYNETGKMVSSLSLPDGSTGMRLCRLGNGQVVLSTAEANGSYGVRLLNTESIGSSITDGTSRFSAYAGWGNTVLLSGGGNLYAMDVETREMEVLLNWVDSNVDPGMMMDCIAVSPETIYYSSGYQETGYQLGMLRQVPATELPERELLFVGSYADEVYTRQLTTLAVAYNRSQKEFGIHLVDYTLYADGETRLVEDAEELDMILAGQQIMEQIELTELGRQLFDEELNSNTLLAGVLGAVTEENGDVKKLPLSFTVKTMVGNCDVLGETPGWTPEEFAEIAADHPEAAVLQFCNAYDTLSALLEGGNYVNDVTPFLRICKNIPVEDDALNQLAGNQVSADEGLLSGNLLLETVELNDFMDWKELSVRLGEKLVCKGYPVQEGTGALLCFSVFLGIPAQSQMSETAWTFLKTVVKESREYLMEQGCGFPVLEADFMEMGTEAAQKVRYEDESGEIVEENPLLWINGIPVEVTPFTEEELSGVFLCVDGCSGIAGCDPELLSGSRAALKQVIEEDIDPAEAAALMKLS